MKITARQHEVLVFIATYFLEKGRAPYYSEIARHFNFNVGRAYSIVTQLVHARKLDREVRPGHWTKLQLRKVPANGSE